MTAAQFLRHSTKLHGDAGEGKREEEAEQMSRDHLERRRGEDQPRRNRSTSSRAVESSYCTGGLFMK
jgi:hypothetical protein